MGSLLKPSLGPVIQVKYFLTPKKKQAAARRSKRAGNKVSEIPLYMAPNNPKFRRKLVYTATVASNATGGVGTNIDLSVTLIGLSSWTTTTALYSTVQVPRIEIQVLPDFYHTNAVPCFFGSMVMYYDPIGLSIASSLAKALEFANSVIVHSSSRLNMLTTIHTVLGVKTPVASVDYVAGFLGSLIYYAPNGSYSNSVSVANIVITFDCVFSYQA